MQLVGMDAIQDKLIRFEEMKGTTLSYIGVGYTGSPGEMKAVALFSLERAAAPFFRIKAYGVHMNGYVEREGEKFLWIGKRSPLKPTYPRMLDHLVAGGLPHGIPCGENIIRECDEEAGIPQSLSKE